MKTLKRRDDFSQHVKNTLARRAADICSNPDCPSRTAGPAEDPTKSVNLGEACHIKGAALGGKRYDASQTPEERSAIANGIWLCNRCSKLIDSDEKAYPVERLHKWKEKHENECLETLRNPWSSNLNSQESQKEILASVLRPIIKEELETFVLKTSAGEPEIHRAGKQQISLEDAFSMYSKMVWTAEEDIIKAGRLLLSVLVQLYASGHNFADANILKFFTLPNSMPVGLKLVIRSYQIALRARLAISADEHKRDLDILIAAITPSDTWAIPACLLIGTVTPIRTLQILRKLLPYLNDPNIWRIMGEDSKIDNFRTEILILFHTDRLKTVGEFKIWLNELEKFPSELLNKSNMDTSFEVTCMLVVDQLWIAEHDKPEGQRDWHQLRVGFLECLAIVMELKIDVLIAAIVHSILIIEADYLDKIEMAEKTAQNALNAVSPGSPSAFLISQTICQQYIYHEDEINALRWFDVAHSINPHGFQGQFINLLISIAGRTNRNRPDVLRLVEEASALASSSSMLNEVYKIRINGELACALWLNSRKGEALDLILKGWRECLSFQKLDEQEKDCHASYQVLVNALIGEELRGTPLPAENKLVGHFCRFDDARVLLYNPQNVPMTEWQLGTLLSIVGDESRAAQLILHAYENHTDPENLASYPLAGCAAAIYMSRSNVELAIECTKRMRLAAVFLDPKGSPKAWSDTERDALKVARANGEDGTRGVPLMFWILSLFRVAVKNPAAVPEFIDGTIHKLSPILGKDEVECLNYASLQFLGKEILPSEAEELSPHYAETRTAIRAIASVVHSSRDIFIRFASLVWASYWASLNIGEQFFPYGYLLVFPMMEYWDKEFLLRGFNHIRSIKHQFDDIENLPFRKKLKAQFRALALAIDGTLPEVLINWINEDE